ncbi:MAG: hypothetical protein L3K15_00150 [Thermoplasmata archaeon]|nr:hypothetical protein [Thermoplasmata archaeon]
MRLLRLAWMGPVALFVLALVPVAAAGAPVHGLVTNCTSTVTCKFVFNTSAGTGWASTTSKGLSFQLPGEAKASYNLSYSTYIGSLIGTYTYWTVGHFLGTDVNTGKVVYGVTDTNFTITCHGHSGRGGGCTYTYTTDNGTIVFHFTTAELTSTSVSCSPSSIPVAGTTTCTAKVSDLWNSSHIVAGKVHLSGGGLGTMSNHGICTLVAGQCALKWTAADNTVGYVAISATYLGSSVFYTSGSSTTVTVTGGD